MEEQKAISDLGGTMRLGAFDCTLRRDRLGARLRQTKISERHRHRYRAQQRVPRSACEDAGW
jgi:CTP synthase